MCYHSFDVSLTLQLSGEHLQLAQRGSSSLMLVRLHLISLALPRSWKDASIDAQEARERSRGISRARGVQLSLRPCDLVDQCSRKRQTVCVQSRALPKFRASNDQLRLTHPGFRHTVGGTCYANIIECPSVSPFQKRGYKVYAILNLCIMCSAYSTYLIPCPLPCIVSMMHCWATGPVTEHRCGGLPYR